MLGNIVNLFVNVCDKSQKDICTICWGYWITMSCIGTGPSQFCEMSAKITDWVIDALRPLLNIKAFPVHRLTESKSCDWDFFFRVSKKKNPPPGGQETIIHLRVA